MEAPPAQSMTCPRDGHALEQVGDYADAPLACDCPVCGGVCVSSLTLAEHARDVIARLREHHLSIPHTYGCPRCRGPMARVTTDDAVLHFCRSCSALWVDREHRAAWSLQPAGGGVGQCPSAGGPGIGVFYRREDHAGFLRRLVGLAIDTLVLVGGSALAIAAAWAAFDQRSEAVSVGGATTIVWIYVYMAVLKATRFGTVGYLLTGCRLVNLKGRTPSLAATSIRLMFLLIGPLNPILDLFYLSGDENRQTLRDKFAATYVVRKHARPAGSGPIEYARHFVLSWAPVFREVARR